MSGYKDRYLIVAAIKAETGSSALQRHMLLSMTR